MFELIDRTLRRAHGEITAMTAVLTASAPIEMSAVRSQTATHPGAPSGSDGADGIREDPPAKQGRG